MERKYFVAAAGDAHALIAEDAVDVVAFDRDRKHWVLLKLAPDGSETPVGTAVDPHALTLHTASHRLAEVLDTAP